jgi:hypothetical protein
VPRSLFDTVRAPVQGCRTRRVAVALLAAAVGLLVTTPVQAAAPGPDRDKDGLKDTLEKSVGLTPGHADRIEFVSGAGGCSNSSSSGRSIRKPLCSLARAADTAPANTTVLVRGGRYGRQSLVRSAAGRVRLLPYPREHVVLAGLNLGGHGLRVQGMRVPGGISIASGARHVSVVGDRTTNLTIGWGASHVLIAANKIVQSRRMKSINGINFNSTNTHPAISWVTIRDNRIGPIPGGGDGIQAKHTSHLTIRRNVIAHLSRPAGSSAHPDAFQSIYGASHLVIEDNFIHNIAAQGIFIQDFIGANRFATIEDNVIARVAHPWVALAMNAAHATVAHNTIEGLLRARGPNLRVIANVADSLLLPAPSRRERYDLAGIFSSKPGAGSIKGAPAFRDPARNDYRLRSGSPGSKAGPGGRDIGSRTANWSHRRLHRR